MDYFIIISRLDWSSKEQQILMNNNNSTIIPLQNDSAQTTEYIVNVKKKKKNITQWLLVVIVVLLIVIISLLIATIIKIQNYRNSSGKYYRITCLHLSIPINFYRYSCKKSFIYYCWWYTSWYYWKSNIALYKKDFTNWCI
jgi:hypothetical protein